MWKKVQFFYMWFVKAARNAKDGPLGLCKWLRGRVIMGKVMDAKQMFLEAKGMYSSPCAACFQGLIQCISQKYHWSTSGSLQQILHGPQWSQHDVGLMNFPPLTEESPSWPISWMFPLSLSCNLGKNSAKISSPHFRLPPVYFPMIWFSLELSIPSGYPSSWWIRYVSLASSWQCCLFCLKRRMHFCSTHCSAPSPWCTQGHFPASCEGLICSPMEFNLCAFESFFTSRSFPPLTLNATTWVIPQFSWQTDPWGATIQSTLLPSVLCDWNCAERFSARQKRTNSLFPRMLCFVSALP